MHPGVLSGQTRMVEPQEDPLAVHCFCVCSSGALLGDLLGVSRSAGHDFSVSRLILVFFFGVYGTVSSFIMLYLITVFYMFIVLV